MARSLHGAEVLSAAAPQGVFSAERAAAHLGWLCTEPHPMGSLAGRRAALRLVDELEASGFTVGPMQPDASPPLNVMGHLPGQGDVPSLLFVAHHDSTPRGPGAGDDGAGVAALLELARVLGTSSPVPCAVSILLTDGEEDGLLGARSFLKGTLPGAVDNSTIVINVEAVGNRGPTALFQAGPGNAPLLAAYADAATRPHASSLAEFIFGLLPNDTDFTEFRRHGFRGLNLAMVGGSAAYHAPFDTPEHLHLPSLQRLGETLLGLATCLSAEDPDASAEDANSLYHSVADFALVTIPEAWGRRLAMALALLSLALLCSPYRYRAHPVWFLAALALPLGGALLGAGFQALLTALVEPLGSKLWGDQPRGDFVSTALTAFGILLAGAAAARVLHSRLSATATGQLCCAGLTLASLGVVALAKFHPGAAWVLAVPLLPAACAARWGARDGQSPGRTPWVATLLCALPVVWLAGVWLDLSLLTSLRPEAMGAIACGTLVLGLPFVAPALGRIQAPPRWPDYASGAAGVLLLLGSSMARGAGY